MKSLLVCVAFVCLVLVDLLGTQVRAFTSYRKNLRIFAARFIRDMSACTAHVTALGSTTTSLLQPGTIPWACMH